MLHCTCNHARAPETRSTSLSGKTPNSNCFKRRCTRILPQNSNCLITDVHSEQHHPLSNISSRVTYMTSLLITIGDSLRSSEEMCCCLLWIVDALRGPLYAADDETGEFPLGFFSWTWRTAPPAALWGF